METEQGWFRTYDRATSVDLGVGDVAADLGYTRECADWLGWQFDRRRGDPQSVIDLLSGAWDEDRFLVLPPGRTFRMTGDDRVIDRVAE